MKAPNSNIQAPEKLQASKSSAPFFNAPDRILRLNLAAAKWRGTPWRPNSSAVGVGVSCHNLPRALYIESRFLAESFPRIESLPAAVTAENRMETFLDARPEFERIGSAECGMRNELLPGDLIGLFIPIDNVGKRVRNSCVNHLGVVLPEGWFVHTLMKKNTDVDLYALPPWSQIIKAAWRPVLNTECGPTESNQVRLGQTESDQIQPKDNGVTRYS